jgi:hypothetical protein
MQRRQQHCLDKPLCAVLRSIAAKKGFVAGPLAPDEHRQRQKTVTLVSVTVTSSWEKNPERGGNPF